MSQSMTLEAPVQKVAKAGRQETAAIETAAPVVNQLTADEFDLGRAWSKIRNDAWLWPKVGVLLAAAFLPAYAIGWSLMNESAGVTIAIIPDMLAAGALLAGILGCVLFLDEDHAHA